MSYKREIVKLMIANGFVLKRSNKHTIWVNALGKMLVVSSTPSDRRTLLNVKTQIKRLQFA